MAWARLMVAVTVDDSDMPEQLMVRSAPATVVDATSGAGPDSLRSPGLDRHHARGRTGPGSRAGCPGLPVAPYIRPQARATPRYPSSCAGAQAHRRPARPEVAEGYGGCPIARSFPFRRGMRQPRCLWQSVMARFYVGRASLGERWGFSRVRLGVHTPVMCWWGNFSRSPPQVCYGRWR